MKFLIFKFVLNKFFVRPKPYFFPIINLDNDLNSLVCCTTHVQKTSGRFKYFNLGENIRCYDNIFKGYKSRSLQILTNLAPFISFKKHHFACSTIYISQRLITWRWNANFFLSLQYVPFPFLYWKQVLFQLNLLVGYCFLGMQICRRNMQFLNGQLFDKTQDGCASF